MAPAVAKQCFSLLKQELRCLKELRPLLQMQAEAMFNVDPSGLKDINIKQNKLIEEIAEYKSSRKKLLAELNVGHLSETIKSLPSALHEKAKNMIRHYEDELDRCSSLNANNRAIYREHNRIFDFIFKKDSLYTGNHLMR